VEKTVVKKAQETRAVSRERMRKIDRLPLNWSSFLPPSQEKTLGQLGKRDQRKKMAA